MQCRQQSDVLKINNLHIEFKVQKGSIQAVRGVNLEVKKGTITALVGESGSGKSATALAIMGLMDSNAKVTKGEIYIDGIQISSISKKDRKKICSSYAGIIFQDPLNSLNPLYTIGNQLMESILARKEMSKEEALKKAIEHLKKMQFHNPQSLMHKYPFELSGGMCQRVMIAMATIFMPSLLIADEPTTALDVTVQAEILKQIYNMSRKNNTGVLFITHDLSVVAEIADEVFVMKDGMIVENQSVYEIFHKPTHPYTKQLIHSIL
ncbi:ABC transporter ATP-binding protein [Inediibacterium massiliense]|uniref:ABC transporter ATP-binding protein n=1 Tax=Inediibacterium massiliense TaxID=1658111 RepID=UPI0006B5FFBB|nr:ABC transporter ATP-binding protein [Inediibacterium massiliense]